MGARGFPALETERLCKFASLVMFLPGEHYISGALQAQSPSAYSSSTDEGSIPRNTVLSREWCFLACLPSGRFDGLLVCSEWQS